MIERRKHPQTNLWITRDGDVYGARGKRRFRKDGRGYHRVNAYRDGRLCVFMVHQLVADVWLRHRAPGETVDHLDGNKLNNRADNLEIVSASENTARAFKNGLVGTCKPVVFAGERFHSLREAERVTGVPRHSIRDMVGV